jgi:hypothetical protein
MGAALSTYWDEVPFNKGKDSFWMHGFFVGLSTIPCMFLGIKLYSVLIYTFALCLSMGFVSHKTKIVPKWNELIRGALIVAFLPLLTL